MADSTAGGRQVEGFHGISLEYMRSRKFLCADGGWNSVVWMPKEIKDSLSGFIPENISEKISTEEDSTDIPSLREFLIKMSHPLSLTWTSPTVSDVDVRGPEEGAGSRFTQGGQAPVFVAGELPITAGGVKIILKNAKIFAEKVIIRPIEPEQKGGKQ